MKLAPALAAAAESALLQCGSKRARICACIWKVCRRPLPHAIPFSSQTSSAWLERGHGFAAAAAASTAKTFAQLSLSCFTLSDAPMPSPWPSPRLSRVQDRSLDFAWSASSHGTAPRGRHGAACGLRRRDAFWRCWSVWPPGEGRARTGAATAWPGAPYSCSRSASGLATCLERPGRPKGPGRRSRGRCHCLTHMSARDARH